MMTERVGVWLVHFICPWDKLTFILRQPHRMELDLPMLVKIGLILINPVWQISLEGEGVLSPPQKKIEYAKEMIGNYQCGFKWNHLTIDQIYSLGQILEEYRLK